MQCRCHALPSRWLAGRRSQLASEPYFWLGHYHNTHPCRDKRVKFLPPLWEPVIPLQISSDSLSSVIGTDVNTFPWLLPLQGRATLGHSGGNRSGSLLSRFYECGDFCMSGEGPGTPDGPSPLPRRVVSSSGVGEGPKSSSWGLNREASITSSPLRVIKRAMHYWNSMMALHRMPVLTPDVSAQACITKAKASVFSCLMTQKFWELEMGGRKSWRQSPWSVGRASHHPEASCCTTGSVKAAAYHRA